MEYYQMLRAYFVLVDPEKRPVYDESGEEAVKARWSGSIFFDDMD